MSPIQPSPNRKFPNFLKAFEDYGNDGYTPPQFNTWTGIAIIAAALERKVWYRWNQTLFFYPNMFVMLVSPPAAGKSTALNRGVDLLNELRKTNNVRFLPNQASEAFFNESVAESKSFFVHGGLQNFHCSAFYYASEASESLKEVYGDLTGTMTNLYDCPRMWKKGTKKDGNLIVENGCLTLLAGSTFDYLGRLISTSNINGGFASRLTYVISRNEEIRETTFPHEFTDSDGSHAKQEDDLVFDLRRINEMTGPFSATKDFGQFWQNWDRQMQKRRHEAGSETIKNLLARHGTSMLKLCMVLSAAESSSRIIDLRHGERAAELLRETEQQLPGIFREARSANTGTPDGLKNAIISLFLRHGSLSRTRLSQELMMAGFDGLRSNGTISNFIENKTIGQENGELRLLVDPNKFI